MTTITIHKHTALGLVIAYTWFIVALTATLPTCMVWSSIASEVIYLLYELTLCCWPQKTERRHESTGEPATEVAAITSLEPKVGEDTDKARDDDEKKSHHHNSNADRSRFVLRRH